jgi:hypothetical protein
MTAIQPSLPVDFPEPEPTDFETWAETVRPAFVAAAKSGSKFASWQIKVAAQLPEPPHPKTDWGAFVGRLRREGLIRRAGWTETRDSSSVRRWQGTRAAQQGRVA